MIRYLLLTFCIIFISMTNAQTPLEEATDFIVTDVNGNEIHLFQLLDEEGKYVLIDFFFTTCSPCQDIAPRVSEAYEYFGCGEFDIEFIAMDWGDTDEECIEFDHEFGVSYPTVSGIDGGGNQVVEDYQIPLFPTVILIAPDHSIVENHIWPIPSAASLIEDLEAYGINQNYCSLNADFIPYNNDICAGEYMLFHDHSVGNIESYEWTFEGGIPNQSNEENPVIYYPNAGEYDVSLKISNNEDEAETIKEEIVKIHNCAGTNEEEISEFQIINNLVKNTLRIVSSNNTVASGSEISILNSMGNIVYSAEPTFPAEIQVSEFASGVYFVVISTKSNTICKSFIKI